MKKNVYVRTGLTVFCTVAAILLFYDTFFASRVLLRIGRQLLRAEIGRASCRERV